MDSARILLLAAELIETRGLARHVQVDGNGGLCAHGAIAMATLMLDGEEAVFSDRSWSVSTRLSPIQTRAYTRALWRVVDVLPSGVAGYGPLIAAWSNASTQEEVVATLRKAVVGDWDHFKTDEKFGALTREILGEAIES